MSLIPDSWGSTLREFNDCHEPAGSPEGGRFCRKGTRAAEEPVGRRAAKDPAYAVPELRPYAPHIVKVWEHSNAGPNFREVLALVNADGKRILPREDRQAWGIVLGQSAFDKFAARKSKVILGLRTRVGLTDKEVSRVVGRVQTEIHSHPRTMPFSLEDIELAADMMVPRSIVIDAENTYVMDVTNPYGFDKVLHEEKKRFRQWQDGPLLQLAVKMAQERGWTIASDFKDHEDLYRLLVQKGVFSDRWEYEKLLTNPTSEHLDALWRRLAADPKNGLTYRVYKTRRGGV